MRMSFEPEEVSENTLLVTLAILNQMAGRRAYLNVTRTGCRYLLFGQKIVQACLSQ
jgi:hypothetical protein